jgi:hypothetical protein
MTAALKCLSHNVIFLHLAFPNFGLTRNWNHGFGTGEERAPYSVELE